MASDSPSVPFVLFSPSHPNESRWYNLLQANFVWWGNPDALYRYSLDTNPLTIPSDEYTTKESRITVDIPGDGVYYFHLQLSSGGEVSHYRILSDRTPPVILSMESSEDAVFVGDVVRFVFDATDTVSGVQKNYYVDLGNNLFLPIGQQLFIPFLSAGTQSIKMRVYDNAGNYTDQSKSIHVSRSSSRVRL